MFTIGVAYTMEEDKFPPSNPDGEVCTDEVPPSDSDNTIDVDNIVDGDRLGKLPQTGGIINSTSLIALGAVVIGAGIVLNKKSEEKEGGKHNE